MSKTTFIVNGVDVLEENEKLKEKLEEIISLCQVPNEPYYNSECEFGKGRIDLGLEILEI